MNSMERNANHAAMTVALTAVFTCACQTAWAQPPATNVGASMVQAPQAPASGANAHNPDNMPIKRPDKPTRDPIARRPPASDAQPK
ncbi:hypothetical protein [Trinickia diaoshuihuensis]|jgi:hypothetical protein|uniref:hypothetical protein n=1 Tax=Trinickia diaoshuihuensis TaxID=2292265 RepID=UPI0013C2DACD|nr:hypothetical protein [Trinickia diaoshuihuensis]